MTAPPEPARARTRIPGTVASPGLAAGRLFPLRDDPAPAALAAGPAGTTTAEAALLEASIEAALADLRALLAGIDDDEAAGIVEFQVAMLEDENLRQPALGPIAAGAAAAAAWNDAMAVVVADYAGAEDEYFRARAVDMRDIRDRVLRHLGGGDVVRPPAGVILLTVELTPTAFLEADWSAGGGIALGAGSVSSHVAMLARAAGVPMLVGLGDLDPGLEAGAPAHLDAAPDGDDADADRGALVIHPDAAELAAFPARLAAAAEARAAEAEWLDRPAAMASGEAVRVMLNVTTLADLDGLDPACCDGIGLVRTEFLFAGAGGLPDEDSQARACTRIVEWAAGRPVTFRTLDAGGDKPIPGLTVEGESNPFLGLRGLRLSLRSPDVFETQLRALLRAAAAGPVRIMLPMVTAPHEVAAARGHLEEARRQLEQREVAFGPVETGMMVEVPAAAIAVEEFPVDFYSIGSNDLVQYVTCCARDNGMLDDLARPDATAVLRLIEGVVRHGAAVGREVSLCGDMAGDPRHIPALLDCGLRSLSVAPPALARTKATIATCGAGSDG